MPLLEREEDYAYRGYLTAHNSKIQFAHNLSFMEYVLVFLDVLPLSTILLYNFIFSIHDLFRWVFICRSFKKMIAYGVIFLLTHVGGEGTRWMQYPGCIGSTHSWSLISLYSQRPQHTTLFLQSILTKAATHQVVSAVYTHKGRDTPGCFCRHPRGNACFSYSQPD